MDPNPKALNQDIERVLRELELHVTDGSFDSAQGYITWCQNGLMLAHTLQGMAAIVGKSHVESFASHVRQIFMTALGENGADYVDHIQSELTLAHKTFYADLDARPNKTVRLSKKLIDAVENLQRQTVPSTLDFSAPSNAHLVSDGSEGLILGDVIQGFLPWIHQLALSQEKPVEVQLDLASLRITPQGSRLIQTLIMNLVRNAITHGIEPRLARKALGKPVKGLIRISVYAEGDTLNLVVSDDGQGFPESFDTVLERASGNLSQGLQSQNDASAVKTSAYAPQNASSGLGLGFHVIQVLLEKAHGHYDISSLPQVGSSVIIHLPLSSFTPA